MNGQDVAGARRNGKRRTLNPETEPKLHRSVLRSHRSKLERTCPLNDEDQSSCAVEVTTAEELEELFAATGLDKVAVHRLGSQSKEDVFRTLHMSYPIQTLEEFQTQLARFVDEEMMIPTINVKTQSDGPPLNIHGVVKYFSKPASKRGDILNITSFNLGHTGLDGLVVAPRIVRDLDLVNRAWPSPRMVRFFGTIFIPLARIALAPKVSDSSATINFRRSRAQPFRGLREAEDGRGCHLVRCVFSSKDNDLPPVRS